jgi:hypothetical protein
MKILVFFIVLSAICYIASAQSTLPLRADTVTVEKVGGNATLKIKNATRDSVGGVLYNIGNGATAFKKSKKHADSCIIIGGDTICGLGPVFSNGLTRTVNTVRLGGSLTQNTTVDAGENTFTIFGPAAAFSFGPGLGSFSHHQISNFAPSNITSLQINDEASATNYNGITVDAPGPNAVGISSNSPQGIAISANGQSTYTANLQSSNTAATIHGILQISRNNLSTGKGSSIDYATTTSGVASRIANVFTLWNNDIAGSITELQFHTRNLTDLSSKMVLNGFGNLGIGKAVPLAGLHVKGGTNTVPSIIIDSGALTSTPINGAIENDGSFLYFTAGGIRNPLGATGANFYTTDGIITSARTVDVDEYPITFSDVGLFRITEGDVTVGGTYDFNNGVDHLVYDADNSSNMVMNAAAGLTFEYTDLSGPTVVSHLKVNSAGVELKGTTKLSTGTTTSAPLKFTAGTNLTTPENGAIEYDGTHYYGTIGSTRYQLDQQGGSGVTTMANIGSSPNADGASISGSTLTLQPANASFGGVLTTGAQTIAGNKTLTGNLSLITASSDPNEIFSADLSGGGKYARYYSSGSIAVRFEKATATDFSTFEFWTGASRTHYFSSFNDGTFRITRDATANDIVIDGSSNIGIGKANPGQKLDVVGIVRGGGASGGLLAGARDTDADSYQFYSPTIGTFHFYDHQVAANRFSIEGGNFTMSSTGWMKPPAGTDAQRPGSPAAGMTRYNTTSNVFEYYNGTAWIQPNTFSLKNSTTWDPGSIGANSSTTTTLTVTGAALGDPVTISKTSGAYSNGEIYDAFVSATNTVTIRLSNLSGGTFDIASATYNVILLKY